MIKEIQDRRDRCGFTLVELLVVIAVIAVLASTMIPAIGGVRDSAHQAKCASNLRQIGQAIALYTQNNKGQFPLSTHTVRNVEESWIYTLAPYLGDVDEIRICPADPRGPERLKANLTSYVLNEYVVVPNRDPSGRLRVDQDFTNILRLENPSKTITAFCASDRLPLGDHSDHTHSRGWNSWRRVLSDIQPNRFGGNAGSNGLGGRANYLYADGHVSVIDAEDFKSKILSGTNPADPSQL
jgi:prepilin-type N-terminal cleavage/methylation domain-containing protein/prepilin-type processing-associated H-X9-DG protein